MSATPSQGTNGNTTHVSLLRLVLKIRHKASKTCLPFHFVCIFIPTGRLSEIPSPPSRLSLPQTLESNLKRAVQHIEIITSVVVHISQRAMWFQGLYMKVFVVYLSVHINVISFPNPTFRTRVLCADCCCVSK